jgi:hypothetical protein
VLQPQGSAPGPLRRNPRDGRAARLRHGPGGPHGTAGTPGAHGQHSRHRRKRLTKESHVQRSASSAWALSGQKVPGVRWRRRLAAAATVRAQLRSSDSKRPRPQGRHARGPEVTRRTAGTPSAVTVTGGYLDGCGPTSSYPPRSWFSVGALAAKLGGVST